MILLSLNSQVFQAYYHLNTLPSVGFMLMKNNTVYIEECSTSIHHLKGQFQGQQTRGERGKKTLPAFAARLLIQQTRGDRGEYSTNARRSRGVFPCRVRRALDARRALRCDLATVLLTISQPN